MNACRRVAVIGLGAIGSGIAHNLLGAGFEVRGCEPDPDALARFVAAGGIRCATPGDAAKEADVVLVCVFDEPQAQAVLFDDDGIVSALLGSDGLAGSASSTGDVRSRERTALIVMHTTMSHHAVSGFAARLSDEGITLVDAPVTGGKAGADAGTLTAISAGPDIALQRLAPVYEPYTTKRYVVGPTPGAATIVKMVNQLLMGVHLTAAAEALNLAMGAGADPELARNVILDGAGFSRAFESRSKAMIAGEHDTVRGAVDIFVKDLGLVTELAKAHDLPTPLADAALEQFQSAAKNGLGRKDCAAVISVYQSTKRT